MMTVRQWHSYIGAFVAPSVLFFAFTGSLQLFSLHEAHGAYRPPDLVVRLSRIHKDQVFTLPPARPSPAGAHRDRGARAETPHPSHAPSWAVTALKWLFVGVAAGLALSTLIGLWIAFTTARRRGVILALVVAGAALPAVLLALQ